MRSMMRANMRPGAAEERIRQRKACEQANAEMLARFAPLTTENAMEAIAWQDARIDELGGRG